LATNTENYNLVKPDENDYYDIGIQNDNMDKIDAELKKAQDHREDTLNPHKVMANQVGAINPNLLINGDFRINQRGKYIYDSPGYTFDRWLLSFDESKVGPTVERGESTSDYGSGGYYAHVVLSSVSNEDNGGFNFLEKLDLTSSERKVLRSKTVTFSAWCHTSADYMRLYLAYLTNDGELVASFTGIPQYSANRYSVSIDIPYDAKQLEFGVACSRSLTANDVGTAIDIAECKLEIGSVATEFSPRPYAEELEMCKKYYRRIIAKGLCSSLNLNALLVALNPSMRTFPTIVSVESPVTHTANTADECGIGEVPFENPSISYGTDEYITFISTTSTLNAGSQYSVLLTLDAEIY
jgi:hypothetical protein